MGDHDVIRNPNYSDASEVVELFYVLHFEFAREEHLDIIDVAYVFSSNYQVINIYYDEYLSFRIALDEQENMSKQGDAFVRFSVGHILSILKSIQLI